MTAPRVSFAATIVATPIAPSYRIGLVVVAAAMMLLPAIYLGLIAATVALVATRDDAVLGAVGAYRVDRRRRRSASRPAGVITRRIGA